MKTINQKRAASLFTLVRTCYYVGPPVINHSRQPKQYGYQVILFKTRMWKPPLYFEWRTRVVMPWESKYEDMLV